MLLYCIYFYILIYTLITWVILKIVIRALILSFTKTTRFLNWQQLIFIIFYIIILTLILSRFLILFFCCHFVSTPKLRESALFLLIIAFLVFIFDIITPHALQPVAIMVFVIEDKRSLIITVRVANEFIF